MSDPLEVTEEQIAAAQLRIVLDEKLGRETPAVVRRIAAAEPSGGRRALRDDAASRPDPAAGTGSFLSAAYEQALKFFIEAERRASRAAPSVRIWDINRQLMIPSSTWEPEELSPHAAIVTMAEKLAAQGFNREAERWYRRAAADRDVGAMVRLADLLVERGEVAEAESWYRRAAATT